MTIIEALKESRESGTSYMRVHGGGAKGSSPLLKAINKPSNDIYRPAPSAIRSGKPDVLKWARMNAGTGTPRPVERPAWLAQAKERLGVLGRLPDGWGGSEKPSERTLAVAWSLVQSMERYGHPVSRIAPMADGGLSIRYLEGPRSARFDVYNEGGIVVATRAGLRMPTRYVALPEADAVVDLSRFLRHDDDATSAG